MDTHIMLNTARWLNQTLLASIVSTIPWVWPTLETLHFIGMSMLVGAIGLFDLRLLGFASRIPISALHRLVRWGVAGFAINLMTGICFLAGTPYEFIFNMAFQFKILFIMLAGLNIVVFYGLVYRNVVVLEPGRDTPLSAKIVGGTSLSLWVGVMTWGRLLTFFRPVGQLHELF